MNKLLVITLCISLNVHGQPDSSGVYVSIVDFQKNKLQYASPCQSNKHAIHFVQFIGKPHLSIGYNEKNIRLNPGDFFGFLDCGKLYRIVNGWPYQILHRRDIVLYSKIIESGTGRGSTLENEYYFSKTTDGALLQLSIKNLEMAFPDNHQFHEKLESQFKDSEDLIAFDLFIKQYKIKTVYLESLP